MDRHNYNKIKFHTHWVGDSQTGDQQYQRSSPTAVNVWNPTSGFPVWALDKGTGNPQGIRPWRPEGSDCKTSTGLGETETPVLEGTNKTLCAPRLRGKEQWFCRKLNQNYLLVLEGLLWGCGSAGAHHRDGGTGSSCLGKPHFGSHP